MSQAVVFLDFDGVVIWERRQKARTSGGKLVAAADRDCVARLNHVLRETGADVVVSSSWRLHHSIPELQGMLDRSGFEGKVIDVTPQLGTTRGFEVYTWLRNHPEVTAYVVLDDDSDRGPLTFGRWVVVANGWFKGGLQDQHAELAIRSLRLQARRAAAPQEEKPTR